MKPNHFGIPARTEHMQRVCRDSAVSQVLRDVREEELRLRDIHRMLDTAVSNALIQYAAMMQVEINRIDLAEEREIERINIMPPHRFIVEKQP